MCVYFSNEEVRSRVGLPATLEDMISCIDWDMLLR